MRYLIIGIGIFLFLIICLVMYKRITNVGDYVNPPVNVKITSNAFTEGGNIPVKHTGRGEDISPQLKLNQVGDRAKSIAVIMDDLDHPFGMFNHWVIWNIPADNNIISEGIPREKVVDSLGEAIQGKSHYGGKHYYRGPKPPFGTHEYSFKIYVLDTVLDLPVETGKYELQKAMKGHILQYGVLTGRFGKPSTNPIS